MAHTSSIVCTLAALLGVEPVEFPGDHGGFMADPAGFAAAIRTVTAESL